MCSRGGSQEIVWDGGSQSETWLTWDGVEVKDGKLLEEVEEMRVGRQEDSQEVRLAELEIRVGEEMRM